MNFNRAPNDSGNAPFLVSPKPCEGGAQRGGLGRAHQLFGEQYIERMGTGTRDMIRRCREAGLPEPVFNVTDGFVISLRRPEPPTGQATPQVTTQATTQDRTLWINVFQELLARATQVTGLVTGQATGQAYASLLIYFAEPKTSREIQDALGLRHRETFLDNYLTPMLEAGLLDRTIPEKPTSPNQRYRLTEKGRARLGALPPEEKK